MSSEIPKKIPPLEDSEATLLSNRSLLAAIAANTEQAAKYLASISEFQKKYFPSTDSASLGEERLAGS